MDQQLRDLPAMGLIGRPCRVKLDGTDDPAGLARDDKDRPGVRVRQRGVPPVDGALDRERREEADGGARLDSVDQELGQGSAIGLVHRWMQPLDRCSRAHGLQCNAARALARQVR